MARRLGVVPDYHYVPNWFWPSAAEYRLKPREMFTFMVLCYLCDRDWLVTSSLREIAETAGLARSNIKPDVAMRIAVYAAEGMPANWIAEDLPVRYETALRHAQRAPGHAEAVREWQIVWHQIRTQPALLELHYEIAPLWSELRLRALDAA